MAKGRVSEMRKLAPNLRLFLDDDGGFIQWCYDNPNGFFGTATERLVVLPSPTCCTARSFGEALSALQEQQSSVWIHR